MALVTYYTVTSGPGVTTAQPLPAESLGGYAATTLWSGGVQHDLFARALSTDLLSSRADYRGIYFYNNSETQNLTDVRVYVTPGTAGANDFYVGADPRPATYLDSRSPQVVETDSVYTAPSGVTFSAPTNYTAGVELGDLPAEAGHGVWFKRVPLGSGGAAHDYVDVTFQDQGGLTLVRRIYWETEPYAAVSQPVDPVQIYTPATSPFRRLIVDYVTLGGTRITWELDKTLDSATGPFVFQLQVAQSSVLDGWTDVGPAVQDPAYLLDTEQRIFGGSQTVSYRVVLTVDGNTYTSPATPAYGPLNVHDYLIAADILRKEQLNMRQFVGVNGFLLKARRYGTVCTCVDPDSGEVRNSSDSVCYGTGKVGGYYQPVPTRFAIVPGKKASDRVMYNEGIGTDSRTKLIARMTADIPLASRDVIVDIGSDDRYYVHEIEEIVVYRGIPIVLSVELRQAMRTDVIYTYPLTRPDPTYATWQTPETIDL